MKSAFAAAAAASVVVIVGVAESSRVAPDATQPSPYANQRIQAAMLAAARTASPPAVSNEALNAVVQRYCATCHSTRTKAGNQILEGFDVAAAHENRALAEKMIRKLRAEMMPPPGARRPTGDTLLALVETLERTIDRNTDPNPGSRPFQRLNRPEYERAIQDLLHLDIDASQYLPLDTKSANFDNIADVQAMSPTLLEAYLNAAAAVAKMAVGDADAVPNSVTYSASPFASQHPWDHVKGAPYGTRGGVVAQHIFPADGEYQFRMNISGGVGTRLEDVEVSLNGERVALLHYERGIERSFVSADAPAGADYLRTERVFIRAGQHNVAAAFIKRTEGPYEDLIRPHDWSLAAAGTGSTGTTTPPHMIEVTIMGPYRTSGVSETASRQRIFSCRPTAATEERACAEQIINRLGAEAYRRPLQDHDRSGLMTFYETGAKEGGFENGIRSALTAMLASPHFVFRIESQPENARPGRDYRISDVDLASRLSFFLWGTLPDQELLDLAQRKRLSNERELEKQVRRMLADPRAEALGTRFAGQWLRLQDLDKVHPDAFWFPDYDQQLADAMVQETELFFNHIVKEDRSVLEMFTADYTFLNERLARHYGIKDVAGAQFRMVKYPDDTRRGILGHGSILVQTSLGNRTSPVLRGKWVMEVLLGSPPPPPPPGVPDLEETAESKDGKMLTTRERMELHRSNAVCRSCHQYMDPMGLALDNFDVTGRWRYRENGMPLDTRGNLYDGTPVSTPAELTAALMKRPIPLVRAFTENLMAYALGRRVEDFDQPTVRVIAKQAAEQDYRMSSFILAVVKSDAFQNKRVEAVTTDGTNGQR